MAGARRTAHKAAAAASKPRGNNTTFSELVTVPAVSGITSTTSSGGAVNAANPFAAFYWNPTSMGLVGASTNSGMSGFGVATFGTTSSGGRTSGGSGVGTARGCNLHDLGEFHEFRIEHRRDREHRLDRSDRIRRIGLVIRRFRFDHRRSNDRQHGRLRRYDLLFGGRQGTMGGTSSTSNAAVVSSSGRDIAYISTIGNPGIADRFVRRHSGCHGAGPPSASRTPRHVQYLAVLRRQQVD